MTVFYQGGILPVVYVRARGLGGGDLQSMGVVASKASKAPKTPKAAKGPKAKESKKSKKKRAAAAAAAAASAAVTPIAVEPVKESFAERLVRVALNERTGVDRRLPDYRFHPKYGNTGEDERGEPLLKMDLKKFHKSGKVYMRGSLRDGPQWFDM
ncbi:hypothetical protein BGZ65_003770 [Modicella reniformis]|uniref:Uncharacterized protein n=1 Tax=Modicella reniformis TaxID=1440133 RepID=A0A9P6M978_9FUNG|nr:hypothetical protein BGZ65_003770 [Modicella reniformis]